MNNIVFVFSFNTACLDIDLRCFYKISQNLCEAPIVFHFAFISSVTFSRPLSHCLFVYQMHKEDGLCTARSALPLDLELQP